MKTSRLLLFSLISLVSGDALLAQPVVYIVRHAEKETRGRPTDPPLTRAGRDRAATLRKAFRSVPFAAVYATEYKRTQETAAEIVAGRKDLKRARKPELLRARDLDAIVRKLRGHAAGEAVLVVGHSDTIPPLLRRLGVKERVAIKSNDYDNVFVVVPCGDAATLVRLHVPAIRSAETTPKGASAPPRSEKSRR